MLDEVELARARRRRDRADLKTHPKVMALEGGLPRRLAPLPDGDLDVVLIVSVLEHLWQPLEPLREIRRVLKPGGTLPRQCAILARQDRSSSSRPSASASSPAREMDDHKMYYDVARPLAAARARRLPPSLIKCFSHKLGLNTFAVCRREAEGG